MNGIATIALVARVTLREAARRNGSCGRRWSRPYCCSPIFAIALRLQVLEFQGRPMSPFVRYQVESGMLMIGLYTCDLLAVVMTILTSIDTIAGEISSGTIHAIATKPLARWQILAGKFAGFAGMISAYVTHHVRRDRRGSVRRHRSIAGASAARASCSSSWSASSSLSVTFLLGTWFSTLTNGVLALGLQGVAFMGGWLEQVSGFSQSAHIVTLGVVVEPHHAERVALATRGVRDADAARRVAVVLAVRERFDPECDGGRVCGGVRAMRVCGGREAPHACAICRRV